MSERHSLQQAIDALEAQRSLLGDDVVDASISALRDKMASLASGAASDRQRKQVTILFADIVDSTRMGESRDPETILEIMDGGLREFGAVIERQGGMVARLMGDGLLAFFGAPIAREDDAQRAVRAGLGIVQAGRDYAAHAAEIWEISDFAVRVGIHTGIVALGEVGGPFGSEYTAMGDATNLAARLQSAAPSNGILISHATYQQVRGLFDLDPQGLLQVRGRSQPAQTYVVLRARPRAFRQDRRGVQGIETRMVGRETQLVRLREAFAATSSQGSLHVVTLVGEAGVGKSRLIYEFAQQLESPLQAIRVYRGRASSELQQQPYGLLRDLFAERFQIQDSDASDAARHKLVAGLLETLGAGQAKQTQAHLIGHLLGFDFSQSEHLQGVLGDARQLRDRALRSVSAFFRAEISRAKTAILLEDLHWADDSSLDALGQLCGSLAEEPLFVVCSARPAFFERRPNWGAELPGYDQVELAPLSEQDSHELVADILKKVEYVPEPLHRLVLSHAEGNPFYIEELIKMLIEDGVIVKGETAWRVEPVQLTQIRVPPTLTGVLQARLDSLSPQEKTTLQQASVVGRHFWDQTLEYLVPEPQRDGPPQEVSARLDALQNREMVFQRATSTFSGTHEFVFKHSTLREVTYESVLQRLRRHYHSLVAEWLIERGRGRAGEYLGRIAEHLVLAGHAEKALPYLRRAGEQAAASYANAEAVAFLTRALELTPVSELSARYELTKTLERVHDLQAARELQQQDLAAMSDLAERMGDTGKRGEVALRRAGFAWNNTDSAAMISAAQAAIEIAACVHDRGMEGEAYLYWGRALLFLGQYEAAQEKLGQGLSISRTSGLLQLQADCIRTLGIVSYYQGEGGQARTHFERALTLYRDPVVYDRSGETTTLSNLGGLCADLGDLSAAQAYCEQALEVAQEIGDRASEGSALGNLGGILIRQGNYPQALVYLRESVRLGRLAGERHFQANGLNNLGLVYSHLGLTAQAKESLAEALLIYRAVEDRQGESLALSSLGLLHHRLDENVEARELNRQAADLAKEIGYPHGQAIALTYLGHTLTVLQHIAEATAAYRDSIELLCELSEPHLAQEPLAGLAELCLMQCEPDQAQQYVDRILDLNQLKDLTPTPELCQSYLTCYRVLSANRRPNAGRYLDAAYALQKQLLDNIHDPDQRHSFLNNVPGRLEIQDEWQRIHADSLSPDGGSQ